MDTKMTSIVGYFGIIGFLIAICAGDKEGAKFHLNQSLVITIGTMAACVIGIIPLIGWLVSLVMYIFFGIMWILGLIAAINQEEKQLPLIGTIQILR